MEALAMWSLKLSPTGCGHTLSEASDRRPWRVRTFTCEACRQNAIVQRHYSDEHEDAKPDRDGALPGDGFGAWVEPPDMPDEPEED